MSEFVHLHCHTEYSLLDGAIRLNDLCARAKDFGMPNLPKKIIPSETLPINSTESFANG